MIDIDVVFSIFVLSQIVYIFLSLFRFHFRFYPLCLSIFDLYRSSLFAPLPTPHVFFGNILDASVYTRNHEKENLITTLT